jgi:hypothetical protein
MNTDSSASTIGLTLRIFPDSAENETLDLPFQNQLSFLQPLMDRFETATGWQLRFKESLSSFQRRQSLGPEESVIGSLEIDDLSAQLEPGKSACHRGRCDQLVATINELVQVIQTDRERIRHSQIRLARVVNLPFDWWELEGRAGFANGQVATWSITHDEKIRLFAGQLQTTPDSDSPLASAVLLSAFESACQAGLPLTQIAAFLPGVVPRMPLLRSHLQWFSTLELDPITGDFELDGFNSDRSTLLIDVQTATPLLIPENCYSGTIYSGQIWCSGIGQPEIERTRRILAGNELSTHQCRRLLDLEFGKSAALFLNRR